MFRVGDRVRLAADVPDPLPWEREGRVERIAPDGVVFVAWTHQDRVRYTYREPGELAPASTPDTLP